MENKTFKPGTNLKRREAKWEVPPRGRLKINVDAGWGRGDEEGYAAAIARDHDGAWVGARTARIHRPLLPLAAELMAINEGFKLAAELNAGEFEVESDCQQAVNLC